MAGGALYIGLDVGTQSTKAVVYEADSQEVVGRGSVGYSLISDRPGQAEQQPSIWIEASST
jgi:xylulokinase